MKNFYLLLPAFLVAFGTKAQILQENFNSASGNTPPAGWTVTDVTESGVNWVFDNPGEWPVQSPIAGNFAILDSYYFSDMETQEDAILVSPVFNASGVSGNLILMFDHEFGQYENATWAVEVYDGVTWTSVLGGSDDMTAPQSVYLDITDATGLSMNAQIRFRWTGIWDDYWMIDNIKIMEELCAPVSDLAVASVMANSASASWTAGGTETLWNISYGLTGFSPAGGTIQAVTPFPEYDLTNLTTGQSYEFYVQADCGADNSIWVGPYQFSTPCVPSPITTLPWVDNFENAVVPALSCGWTSQNVNNDDAEWVTDQSFFDENQYMVLTYNYDGETASDDWAFTPEFVFQAGINYQIIFKELSGDGDFAENLEVSMGTTAASSSMTTSLLNLPGVSTAEFTAHTINFTVPANGSYFFGFHGYSEADMLYVMIDDVKVRVAPTCPEVYDVVIDDLTGNSVTVSWTPGLSETEWTVEIGPAGFTPGTGIIINVFEDPTVLISDLSGNMPYDIYVTAACGAGDFSEPAGPIGITTFCSVPVITSYPWTEDFESADYGDMPCGWTQNDANGDEVVWGTTDIQPASGSNALTIEYNYEAQMNDWAITPGFEMAAGVEYTISFNYAVYSETYPESFEVFVGNAQSAGAMTTSLQDYNGIINVDYANDELSFTPAATGIYYFGFHGYSDANEYYIFIDDVVVDENCETEAAEIAYSQNNFCMSSNPSAPVITGTTGGTFSAPAGLSIDAATGLITPSTSTAGTYNVTYVTSVTGCADTASVSIVISQCLGLDENLLSGISLYPNPTSGKVSVTVTGVNKDLSITVVDASGKTVLEQNESGNSFSLDLGELENGMYLVHFSSASGSSVERIMISK